MIHVDDLGRSIAAFDHDSTLVVVIEMSKSSPTFSTEAIWGPGGRVNRGLGSRGLHYTLLSSCGELPCCGDSWWGLRRQGQVELADEELLIDVGLGIPGQDQGAVIRGGEVNIEHLDRGELVEDGPWCQAGGERPEPGAQRDVQAIGHEGDEDVGFDPLLQLVVDRAQPEIVLEGFKSRLDLDQLDVKLP